MNASVPHQVVVCPQCGTKNRVPSAASGTPRCAKCKAPLPWLAKAGDDDFNAVVDDSRLPVLVDLWAPWCGPCNAVSPALERLATDFAGKVKLVKVNVDEAPSVSKRFSVQGIPTLLLVANGDVVARQTGAAPEPALRAWLERGLAAVRARAAS
jgi:thioredoxin 2